MPVDGWGCYKLVSEHGYNIEPRWAMLVENEEKVSKELFSKQTKFEFRAKVLTLNLYGLDKWSLDPKFQVEIVLRGTNFEPHNIPECQEVTLAVLRSLGGVTVS